MEIKTAGNVFIDVKGAVTYAHYLNMLEKLVLKKKTSGADQSEEKISATKINLQRMMRIGRDAVIDPSLLKSVQQAEQPVVWLVITEAWCGDAAQNLPVIHKIADLSNNKIHLLLVFRDENPDLINQYLTNGSRSIPILICINAETHEVLGTWGPRPRLIQELLNNYKKENPHATHSEIMYHVHLHYFHDKSYSLQSELTKMIDECNPQLSGAEIHH